LPIPKWLIEIGTFLMRTESELVLKSRRAVPGRLVAAGFQFLFPEWPAAARELVSRWRSSRAPLSPLSDGASRARQSHLESRSL
jgi:hypothetical protein